MLPLFIACDSVRKFFAYTNKMPLSHTVQKPNHTRPDEPSVSKCIMNA